MVFKESYCFVDMLNVSISAKEVYGFDKNGSIRCTFYFLFRLIFMNLPRNPVLN